MIKFASIHHPMKKKLNILALSSWYPKPSDPQEGVFVQQQLQAIQKDHHVTLILSRPSAKFKIEKTVEENLTTLTIHYASALSVSKPVNWLFSWRKALSSIKDEKFDLIHLHVIFPLGIIAL